MGSPKQPVIGSLIVDSQLPDGMSGLPAFRNYGPNLDELLLECIDGVLTDVLGTRAREAVYDHLERNCLMSRSELPHRLDDFSSLLEGVFGKGNKTITKAIAKRLYAKLSWEFVEIPHFELNDYLDRIRLRIATESTRPTAHVRP